MKQILRYSVLFIIVILHLYDIQAQNDTISPENKWLSDSVFAEPVKSLFVDSLLVTSNPAVSPLPAPIISPVFPVLRALVLQGITEPKIRKSLFSELKKIRDTLTLRTKMEEVAADMRILGFMESSFEGYSLDKDSLTVFFHQGKKYLWEKIELRNLPPRILEKSDILPLTRKALPADWELLEIKLKSLLYEYQKEGYPFASFRKEQIHYTRKGKDSAGVQVSYLFDKGIRFSVDSVVIKGKYKETPRLIYTMIGISPGNFYNQEKIDNIPQILNNTIYYKSVKPPKTEFTYIGGSKVIITLEPRRTNKFDILVGVLPPSGIGSTPETDKRFQWIASMDIALVSMLKYGESLQIKYDQLTQGTRKMNLKLQVPYLFHLPLHAQGEFELFKQKSDFLNRLVRAGGEYGFSPFLSVRFQYKARFTGLDTSYVNAVLDLTRPLSILDGNTQVYGLGFRYEKTDYKFNPSKGWVGNVELSTGKTLIKKNPRFPYIIYDSLGLNRIDSLRWSQPVTELDLSLKWYYKVGKRNVLHLANRTYFLWQHKIFQNDQLPLGGSRSIRGFNENQFFSNRFLYFTAEYRFLLEQNTYLFTFCDAGRLSDRVLNAVYYPIGIGMGITYDTPAGLVTFTYAFGQAGDIPFQPGRGKIHLGLVSQF